MDTKWVKWTTSLERKKSYIAETVTFRTSVKKNTLTRHLTNQFQGVVIFKAQHVLDTLQIIGIMGLL